jgi:hypothetical protein
MDYKLDKIINSDLKKVKEYRWKTQDGFYLKPSDMRTSHLFHTVVMLWHHHMPVEAWLYNHKRYHLGRRFTHEYVEISLKVLIPELFTRDNLTEFHKKTLIKMNEYLQSRGERYILEKKEKVDKQWLEK